MNAQIKRIAAFQAVTEGFNKPVIGDCETTYTCKKCDQQTTFKNPAVYAAIKVCRQMVCRKCPKDYPGFTRCDDGSIKCDKCELCYHKIKESNYYTCLCSIKTKREEYKLYRKLQDAGFKLSREEYPIPGNKHKVDIRAERDGKVFWIEVDGGSHKSQKQRKLDKEFDAAFAEYIRWSNDESQHLMRVFDSDVEIFM